MTALRKDYTLTNPLGFHARAAGVFVNAVNKFRCEVRVMKGGHAVNGKSILGLLVLQAPVGSTVTVEATGPDAAALLERLEKVFAHDFHRADRSSGSELYAENPDKK